MPGEEVLLLSTDERHDGLVQRVYPDGSVRLPIDPNAPQPPGEDYALVQDLPGPTPDLR